MALSDVLSDLRRDARFMANVTAWQTLPVRSASCAPIPSALYPPLAALLRQRHIEQLYSHQQQALELALDGQNVAVVTPTASGKTLCYNLPVFQCLLTDPAATALYLFPTKALAQDQLAELDVWKTELAVVDGPVRPTQAALAFHTYDGDTPSAQRAAIRRRARLLLTNPDMLHVGILPYHSGWADFFAGLRYVVIDEMHTYRGVFGSHVANVLRRLQRVARFYGSRPQFILTSATIANPKQLAERLVEAPVSIVDRNGASRGEKHIVLYNPPLYDQERGLRRSSVLEAQEMAARFLLGGVQTITFARARLTVEVLLTYLRQRLSRTSGASKRVGAAEQLPISDPQSLIRGYRGGYLPEERRAIEAGLRNGDVRGVVTTNALELGIDIGQLEAAVLCGYPGTIASTWQQMGRAGRTADASIALLVATAGALDQYIVDHPQFLLERSPEHAFINADNPMLLVDQMRCAAFELPFRRGESFGTCPSTDDVLTFLAEEGDLHRHDGRYLWSGESYPARQVSLRTTTSDQVTIQSRTPQGMPQVIGEIDAASAPLLVHEGAVYIHEGQSYLVEEFDQEQQLALVIPTDVDYYTSVGSQTEIEVLAIHEEKRAGQAGVAHGELLVSTQIVDYRRIKHFTHENLGVYPLNYPPQLLETNGYWVVVPVEAQAVLARAGQWRDAPNEYGPNWQEQRARVRARDGYRCASCDAPEPPGSQHDVHHIVPFRTFGYVPGVNENYRTANRLGNLMLVCRRCHQRLEAGVRTRGGLDGLGYALANLAPLHLMCDRSDIGVSAMREAAPKSGPKLGNEATDPHAVANPQNTPRIYVFERVVAGLGFSQQLFERHDQLLAGAEELIRSCPCRHGCPACVGPVPEGPFGAGEPLLETKRLTLSLIQVLRTGQVVERWAVPKK